MPPTRQQLLNSFEGDGAIERIARYARRISSEPQDVVQTALVYALRRASSDAGEKEFPAENIERWLRLLIRSVTYDQLRLQHRRRTVTVPNIEEDVAISNDDDVFTTRLGPEKNLEQSLLKGLAQLTTREKRVITLLYFEGFRIAEAARRLRVSPAAVRKTHARALRRLHRALRVGNR